MNDDAFEALLGAMVIACEDRPDRYAAVRHRMRSIQISEMELDSLTRLEHVDVVLDGRRMRGYVTDYSYDVEQPYQTVHGYRGASNFTHGHPTTQLRLTLRCE